MHTAFSFAVMELVVRDTEDSAAEEALPYPQRALRLVPGKSWWSGSTLFQPHWKRRCAGFSPGAAKECFIIKPMRMVKQLYGYVLEVE